MAGPKFRGLMRKVTSTGCRQSRRNERLSNIDENLSNMYEDGTLAEQWVEREATTHLHNSEDSVAENREVGGEQGFEAQVSVQERNNGIEIRENKVEGAETENVVDKGKYIPIGGYDTPIDPLTQKRPLEWRGTQFKNKSAARLIRSIWDMRFTEPWYTFSKVPQEKRLLLFNEFKRAYTYDSIYEHKVYEIWQKKAASILKKKLNRARVRAKRLRQSTTMINCRDTPPVWIQADVWNKMIDIEWHKSSYDGKCEKMRANRLTPKEGTHTRHTAGSVSIVSHKAQVELETGKPMSFEESFVAWHTKREKAKEKGKAKCASISTCEFVDNKSRKVYETYLKKKAELQEDENVWNPRLWVESSGGLTRGRVYGAPYVDMSTILNKGSQSNLLADRANQEQPIMSTSMTLTSEVKSIIEREVKLAVAGLFGSSNSNNLQSTNQQAWMNNQPFGQISQLFGQPFVQPPSQILQPPTQPFPQPPTEPLPHRLSQVPQTPQPIQYPPSQIQQPPTQPFLQPPSFLSQPPYQVLQPCDQPFLQIPNYTLQSPGQSSQPLYGLTQPSTPCQQTLEQYQTMHVPLQTTFGNTSQQVGSFMQLLRPITQDGLDLNQTGNYQASTENHLSQTEDNI